MLTAIDSGVSIVAVCITSGTAPYDFAAALQLMTHLDTLLDAETQGQLSELGVDLADAAFKLSNTLPHVISVRLDMNESRGVLRARIEDIVSAISKVKLPVLPPDRAAWLAARGEAPRPFARRVVHQRTYVDAPESSTSAPVVVTLPVTLPGVSQGQAGSEGPVGQGAHTLE